MLFIVELLTLFVFPVIPPAVVDFSFALAMGFRQLECMAHYFGKTSELFCPRVSGAAII